MTDIIVPVKCSTVRAIHNIMTKITIAMCVLTVVVGDVATVVYLGSEVTFFVGMFFATCVVATPFGIFIAFCWMCENVSVKCIED